MFGYTVVEKLYIKRLKEELVLLYDLTEKLDKETGELLLRAGTAERATVVQLKRIAHLEEHNRKLLAELKVVDVIREGELQAHSDDWDVERNQPVWITMGDQIEAQEQTIAALTGENEELKLRLKVWEE